MVNSLGYQRLYKRLKDVARAGQTMTYAEAAQLLGLNSQDPCSVEEIDHLLGDIACQESAEGRPLLSAVVLHPDFGYPGKAFFQVARTVDANNCHDDRSYFSYELKKVHDYWAHSEASSR